MVSFALPKLFSLISSHLTNSTFVACAFGARCPPTSQTLPTLVSWSIPPLFSFSHIIVSGTNLSIQSILSWSLTMVTKRDLISFFCLYIHFCQYHFIDETVVYSMHVLKAFVKASAALSRHRGHSCKPSYSGRRMACLRLAWTTCLKQTNKWRAWDVF